jgi:hypothetical protein
MGRSGMDFIQIHCYLAHLQLPTNILSKELRPLLTAGRPTLCSYELV